MAGYVCQYLQPSTMTRLFTMWFKWTRRGMAIAAVQKGPKFTKLARIGSS